MTETRKPVYLHKDDKRGDIQVWIVDGRLVRNVFDLDFTAGGHNHVCEFVPKDALASEGWA